MPAEILFTGGRLDSVVVINGSPVDSTLGRDLTYVDASIECATSSHAFSVGLFTETANVLSATTVVSGETIWFHCDMYVEALSGAVVSTIYFRDSSNFDWFTLRKNGTFWGIFYNSGTGASPVWTQIGTDFTIPSNSRSVIDLSLTLGSPHSASVYLSGSLQRTGTFTQASLTNIAKIVCSGGSGTNPTVAFSQLIATRDIPTLGAKVKYCRATADGANTAWGGSFSDVNEAIGSDTSGNTSATAGQKETHAMGDVTVPGGTEIKAIFHWLRAKNDGSAPTNIKSVLRSGGVDYSTGNLSGIGLGFSSIGARYTQNPNGPVNWTQTDWNAVEAGYESAA